MADEQGTEKKEPRKPQMYGGRAVDWRIALTLTIFVFLTAVWMMASSGIVITDTSSDSTPYKFSIFTMVWGIILFIIGAVGAGYISNDVHSSMKEQKEA
jgi:hypothetical protein